MSVQRCVAAGTLCCLGVVVLWVASKLAWVGWGVASCSVGCRIAATAAEAVQQVCLCLVCVPCSV